MFHMHSLCEKAAGAREEWNGSIGVCAPKGHARPEVSAPSGGDEVEPDGDQVEIRPRHLEGEEGDARERERGTRPRCAARHQWAHRRVDRQEEVLEGRAPQPVHSEQAAPQPRDAREERREVAHLDVNLRVNTRRGKVCLRRRDGRLTRWRAAAAAAAVRGIASQAVGKETGFL
eukprot:5682390-Pleurochrysis_carterae.AAC.2